METIVRHETTYVNFSTPQRVKSQKSLERMSKRKQQEADYWGEGDEHVLPHR